MSANTNSIPSTSSIESIAFVDSDVNQSDSLLQGLQVDAVFLLNDQNHAIVQITQTLEQYKNLDSIHILSHGSENTLQFANGVLSQNNLQAYEDELAAWGNTLSQDGDILFYGCNLAVGSDQFIQQISLMTQADVAASDDITGHSSLGGDWNLEVSVGQIEAAVAVAQTTQLAYDATLDTKQISVGSDGTVWRIDLNDRLQKQTGNTWQPLSGWLSSVSVGSDTNVWGVNSVGNIYRWNGNNYTQISKAGINDTIDEVSVGEDGSVWALGTNDTIWRWNGTNQWSRIGGSLENISVVTDNNVWGNNAVGDVYQWNGSRWSKISTTAIGSVSDIDVGADGTVVAIADNESIWRQNGATWTQLPGYLDQVSVGNGNNIWGVNRNDNIYQYNGQRWRFISSATQRLQAELGTFTGSARTTNIHGGFDGTGFVGYLTTSGSGVKLNTAVSAGKYDLNIRYAAGVNGGDSNRSVSLIVNGTDVGQLSFPRTGSWNNWDTLSTTVDLQTGNNTIEFRVDGGDTGYINVDYIDLAAAGTSSGVATSARLQAETGTFSGSARTTNIHGGFDGTGFVGYLTAPGSGVELNTSVAAGTYDLNIRYAAGVNGPATNRLVSLVVNGSDVGQLPFATTGNWSTWSTLSTSVDLQAGDNTIEFRVDGNDTGYINVDYIDLELAGSNPGGSTSARIQAETGTFTGRAASTNIHGGFDGDGFVGYLTAPGSGVELNTNVTAGTYDLNIRYAAGVNGPATNRLVSLVVNGSDVGQLPFATTGNWSTWSTLSTSVDLQAGDNTIEFRVDGNDTGYINVDYIDIVPPGSSGPIGSQGPQTPIPSSYQLNLTTFATHSEFQSGGGSNPTGTASAFGAIDVGAPRDGSGRVFVSSQTGKILGYDQNGNSLGTLLDLAPTAATTGFINGEGAAAFRGLMYFDFHPDFNNVGTAGYRKLYTVYQVVSSFDNGGVNADYRIQDYNNRAGDNQYAIGEWTISASNPNAVDLSSFREVFRVQMEGNNPHGIGEIAFNPNSNPGDADYGLLYATIGDANARGNGAPASGYLQELDNPFAKIIRINPLQNGSDSYSIPSSNPFVGQTGVAEEIYAVGFRDAQTFSFGKDSPGEDVLIAFDIGASQREEISLVRSGGNYGWGRFEGTRLNNSNEPLAPGTAHSPTRTGI